jgi:hypothetical protein
MCCLEKKRKREKFEIKIDNDNWSQKNFTPRFSQVTLANYGYGVCLSI